MRAVPKDPFVIVSSNVVTIDPSYLVFDIATTYNPKDKVQTIDGSVYIQVAVGSIVGIDPQVDNPDEWSYYGVTNYKACQDPYSITQTKRADNITYEFQVSDIDTVFLDNIEAESVIITLTDNSTSTVVYQTTHQTRKRFVQDWFDFLYAKPEFVKKVYAPLNVMVADATLKIEILFTGSTAKVGSIMYGLSQDIGATTTNTKPTITKRVLVPKVRNKYTGVYNTEKSLVINSFKVGVHIKTSRLDYIADALDRFIDEPTLFVGDERVDGHISLILYGLYQKISLPRGISGTVYTITIDGFI